MSTNPFSLSLHGQVAFFFRFLSVLYYLTHSYELVVRLARHKINKLLE
jgi:hypothetical protein